MGNKPNRVATVRSNGREQIDAPVGRRHSTSTVKPIGKAAVVVQPAPIDALLDERNGYKMYIGGDGRIYWVKDGSNETERLYNKPPDWQPIANRTSRQNKVDELMPTNSVDTKSEAHDDNKPVIDCLSKKSGKVDSTDIPSEGCVNNGSESSSGLVGDMEHKDQLNYKGLVSEPSVSKIPQSIVVEGSFKSLRESKACILSSRANLSSNKSLKKLSKEASIKYILQAAVSEDGYNPTKSTTTLAARNVVKLPSIEIPEDKTIAGTEGACIANILQRALGNDCSELLPSAVSNEVSAATVSFDAISQKMCTPIGVDKKGTENNIMAHETYLSTQPLPSNTSHLVSSTSSRTHLLPNRSQNLLGNNLEQLNRSASRASRLQLSNRDHAALKTSVSNANLVSSASRAGLHKPFTENQVAIPESALKPPASMHTATVGAITSPNEGGQQAMLDKDYDMKPKDTIGTPDNSSATHCSSLPYQQCDNTEQQQSGPKNSITQDSTTENNSVATAVFSVPARKSNEIGAEFSEEIAGETSAKIVDNPKTQNCSPSRSNITPSMPQLQHSSSRSGKLNEPSPTECGGIPLGSQAVLAPSASRTDLNQTILAQQHIAASSSNLAESSPVGLMRVSPSKANLLGKNVTEISKPQYSTNRSMRQILSESPEPIRRSQTSNRLNPLLAAGDEQHSNVANNEIERPPESQSSNSCEDPQ